MTETSEVLYRAADLIEERGWVRDGGWVMYDEPGSPVCIEGAIQAAAGFPAMMCGGTYRIRAAVTACPAYRAVCAYLGDPVELYHWNDREDRTASEVVEVLRAVAVIEAARENALVTA